MDPCIIFVSRWWEGREVGLTSVQRSLLGMDGVHALSLAFETGVRG